MSSFWENWRLSSNVEDQRTQPRPPPNVAGKATGIGGILGLGLLLGYCGNGAVQPTLSATADRASQFVAAILASTEDEWKAIMPTYRVPKLTLYTKNIMTKGCDFANAAVGPFYCPGDQRVYLELSFFVELTIAACKTAGDPCDFARAYVIAHEVGHHVQNLLGTMDRADRERKQEGAKGPSVRLELQADCFAGIWAGKANVRHKFVKPDYFQAAIEAAQFGGDDHFGIPPSEYTHGTAAQRKQWFMTGYKDQTINACDTWGAVL